MFIQYEAKNWVDDWDAFEVTSSWLLTASFKDQEVKVSLRIVGGPIWNHGET